MVMIVETGAEKVNLDIELQEERRRNDTLVLTLMREIKESVDRIDGRLTKHIAEETEQFDAIFAKSFPGADPDGHRRYHEEVVKQLEDKSRFYRDMRDHLTKWGLIGVVSWLAYVAWAAFVKGPK